MEKTVYLDQNKWIDLARSFHGRDDGKEFDAAREYIEKKTSAGEWVVPISVVHYHETAANLNDERRKRLATFMSKLSRQHAIQPYTAIQEEELENALRKAHGLPTTDISEIVIVRDLLRSVGLRREDLKITAKNPEVLKFVEEFLNRDDLFEKLLTLPQDAAAVAAERAEDLKLVQILEKDRAELSKLPEELQYKLPLVRYFNDVLAPSAVKILKRLGIPREQWVPFATSDAAFAFLESIPSLDVRSKLNYSTMRDADRPVHPHDNNDIAFLATAIPYCDVVVTEKSWVHHAKKQNLNTKYSTKLYTSVKDLLTES